MSEQKRPPDICRAAFDANLAILVASFPKVAHSGRCLYRECHCTRFLILSIPHQLGLARRALLAQESSNLGAGLTLLIGAPQTLRKLRTDWLFDTSTRARQIINILRFSAG